MFARILEQEGARTLVFQRYDLGRGRGEDGEVRERVSTVHCGAESGCFIVAGCGAIKSGFVSGCCSRGIVSGRRVRGIERRTGYIQACTRHTFQNNWSADSARVMSDGCEKDDESDADEDTENSMVNEADARGGDYD